MIYPLVPFPASVRLGFPDYMSMPLRWTPLTRARASPPGMAAPLHAVRAQHVLPSAHAPRASPRAHPALILPKHSPVRPRLNCFLTFNCSRVPCSELTSSRSTREALRAHPATIAVEVRGALTELEHAPAPRLYDTRPSVPQGCHLCLDANTVRSRTRACPLTQTLPVLT